MATRTISTSRIFTGASYVVNQDAFSVQFTERETDVNTGETVHDTPNSLTGSQAAVAKQSGNANWGDADVASTYSLVLPA